MGRWDGGIGRSGEVPRFVVGAEHKTFGAAVEEIDGRADDWVAASVGAARVGAARVGAADAAATRAAVHAVSAGPGAAGAASTRAGAAPVAVGRVPAPCVADVHDLAAAAAAAHPASARAAAAHPASARAAAAPAPLPPAPLPPAPLPPTPLPSRGAASYTVAIHGRRPLEPTEELHPSAPTARPAIASPITQHRRIADPIAATPCTAFRPTQSQGRNQRCAEPGIQRFR